MHGASGGAASSESGLPPAFDVEAAKARLRRDGLVVIERAFAPNEVAEIKEALADVIEADRAGGVRLQGFAVDRDALNIRVVMLAAKHAKFREMAENPIALALANEMLGERMQLSSFSANITSR